MFMASDDNDNSYKKLEEILKRAKKISEDSASPVVTRLRQTMQNTSDKGKIQKYLEIVNIRFAVDFEKG